MSRFEKFFAVLVLLSLAACGGGGGKPGTSPFGSNTSTSQTTASKLSMVLSETRVQNSSTTPVLVTVTATDATGKTVSGAKVDFSVATQDANITVVSGTTDAKGEASAEIRLGDNKADRSVGIVASVGSVSVAKSFVVVGSKIDATATPTLIDPSANGQIEFVVKDANGNGQSGVDIAVSATGLPSQTQKTLADGSFKYTYQAPNSPGSTLIFTAQAAGVTKQVEVAVKAPAQGVPVVSDMSVVAAPSLQVTPNVVAVNTAGSKVNRTQLVANFETASGLPVPNVRVMYRLTGANAQAIGGEFSNGGSVITGSPLIYSGADGKAQAFYIPSTVSSGNDKVTLEACYGGTDAAAQACTTSLKQSITIVDEPVSVTIGTDNQILDEAANLRYSQRFVIQVVDAAGQPKSGVQISAQVSTINFIKGAYSWNGQSWTTGGLTATCSKEDLDSDDNKDVGEDLDHDGQLEPVRADVTLGPLTAGVTTTNSDGVVIFKMSYPKDKGSWMTVGINVTALVGGSEGRATRVQVLGVPIDDIKKEGAPAFVFSPYGTQYLDVAVPARIEPDGFARPATAALPACQNKD